MYEDLIKSMNEYIEKADALKRRNPELARKLSLEGLQKVGIIGKDGKNVSPQMDSK